MTHKPKIAMYWAAGCGGCEIGFLGIGEKLLEVEANLELIFCPCLVDTKKKDLESLDKEEIALTFFNGAIRTAEDEKMAKRLRDKSRLLVAFGTCAGEGGIPGLSNFSAQQNIYQSVYTDNYSTPNEAATIPKEKTSVPEGELHLPPLLEKVKKLNEVVQVDYYLPGCPPEAHRIEEVLDHVMQGKELPPAGSVLGAGQKTVCEECRREKQDKSIPRFYRTHEIIPEETKCLLEQGIICMGISTRDGCGGLCPEVNMPCTGCYGTPEGITDQGAKMASALGSILDISGIKNKEDEDIEEKVRLTVSTFLDYAGTFYRFTLPNSILKGRKSCGE